jgi:hypothetical protein
MDSTTSERMVQRPDRAAVVARVVSAALRRPVTLAWVAQVAMALPAASVAAVESQATGVRAALPAPVALADEVAMRPREAQTAMVGLAAMRAMAASAPRLARATC